MKKLVLALVAVSLASVSFACNGSCTGEKSDKPATEQSGDGQKKA